jgi:antitoxin VapB
MALSLKHPEADRLARELAAAKGESITDAVIAALRESLARQQRSDTARKERVWNAIREAQERLAKYPVLDTRSDDEIIGYDENGLFG